MITKNKKWAGRATALTALTATTTMAFSGLAFADNINDSIADGGAITLEAGSSTGGTATIKVVSSQGNDGDSGCNLDGGTEKLVLSFITPTGVTVDGDPATAAVDNLTMTACDVDYSVLVKAGASAVSGTVTAAIALNTSGSGTYNNNVNIPVTVTQPAATNTAPRVSVTGVAEGASYQKSIVPQPGCSVVDDEDTNESATVQVSNGAYNDLGSHTATCSYTDGGGITRSASATYTVVRDKDTTAPVVGYTLSPATPDGANGWYTGNVSLDWTVTEDESSETLDKTGCVDQSITADRAATEYDCSATSEGGTDSESVTIKRDGTGPEVSYDGVVSGTTGANGWYKSDVTVKFTATDALSGPGSASQNVTTSGDGASVTVGSPAFSDAAGNTTVAGNKTSPEFKIDSQAPNAPTASLDPAPNGAGWNNSDVVVSFVSAGDNGPSGIDTSTCTSVTVNAETASRTVSGTCTDNAGNVSAATEATVKLDKNAPVISDTVTVKGAAGTNGWYKSDVEVTFSATDTLSGPATATKMVTSSGEGDAVEVASPAFTDRADNSTAAGEVTKSYKIDKAAPTDVAFVNGPVAGSSSYFGSVPTAPTCTADDATSGFKDCVVTGYSTATGTHTMTATATDYAGHTATVTRTYTVSPWTAKGFYSPVDMSGVWNTVKGGSTVPLKFELFAAAELTDTAAVKSFTQKTVACPGASATVDEIEVTSTGGTSLRYDSTSGQFIQNWATPKKPGTCYQAIMTAQDGLTISANFMLK